MAKHHVAGAAPDLNVVPVQVLDGLGRDVLGLVDVDVGRTGGQLTEVQVEARLIGVLHDFSEQLLNVKSGHVLDIAVEARPVVFHAVVVLRRFIGHGLDQSNGGKGGQQQQSCEQAGRGSSRGGHRFPLHKSPL